MLGDARLASDFANDMLEKGIYVIGFSFPVVPKGNKTKAGGGGGGVHGQIQVEIWPLYAPPSLHTCINLSLAIVGNCLKIYIFEQLEPTLSCLSSFVSETP